ncbi:excisionase [Morganella morganii]
MPVLKKGKRSVPPALKVGKKWMVDRDARYVGIISKPQLPGNSGDMLRRILSDGCETTHS